MICETAFLKALHKAFPKARIDVYLDKVVASLFKNCPYINVIENKQNKFIKKVKILKILNSIYESLKKRKKYDLYFIFTNEMRFFSVLALRILSPEYTVSVYRKEKFGIKKDELTIYDKYIETSQKKHMRDICLSGLEAITEKVIEDRKYEICLGNLENKYNNYFDKNNINIIFNYLGSTNNKNLSYLELKESCTKLIKIREDIIVHIMTIPTKYKDLSIEIQSWNEKRIKICSRTEDILDASALIKNADIMISVDTGVVHIASAFNIPVISIFPNNENTVKYFSPVSDLSYVIKCNDKHYIKNFDKDLMCKYVIEILSSREI